MKQPLISVVMPVYNAEKYVAEAIESILNQTYDNFEFIIIDDCSIDNSYQILQSYAVKDNRIRLFQNDKNRKQAYTKNRAIEKVAGKYIAFMDADDISLPERFAKQIEFMESHPEIGVCGTWVNEFQDSISYSFKPRRFPITSELIRVHLLFEENCLAHPSTMLRGEIFGNVQFAYNESLEGYAEDYCLWLDLLKLGIKFYNLPECLLLYRKSVTQTMFISKNEVISTAQDMTKNNFRHYFYRYLNNQQLDDYLQLRYTPKKKITFCQNIYYQYLIYIIKRINKINKLFDSKEFDLILNKESLWGLICRYISNRLI